MTMTFGDVRWRRIVAAALAAFLTSGLVSVLIVTSYAFTLGYRARGMPDQARISAFAHQIGPIWGPRLLILCTVAAAFWVARRVSKPVEHGLLVGGIAAMAGLLPAWPVDVRDAMIAAVVITAGLAGGFLGGRLGHSEDTN